MKTVKLDRVESKGNEHNVTKNLKESFFAVNRYVNYAVVSNLDKVKKTAALWLRITDEINEAFGTEAD